MIDTIASDRIFEKMDERARQAVLPLRVLFELTYRCNFSCGHCAVLRCGKRRKELDTGGVLAVLDQLARLGCFFIGFTGGEIFTRPDLRQVISHAAELGMQVILLTNGSLIGEAEADFLSRLPVNKVDISLHSLDTAVFGKITGKPEGLSRVLTAISLLRGRGVPVSLKSSAMRLNRSELPLLSRFAAERKIPYRVDYELLPAYDHSTAPMGHGDSEAYCAAVRQASAKVRRDTPMKAARRKIARFREKGLCHCGAGSTSCVIDPVGNMKLCHQISAPVFPVPKLGAGKAWERCARFAAALTPPADWKCLRCDLLAYCSWCPGKSFLHTGTLTSCSRLIRRKARLAREAAAKGHERNGIREIQ